MKSPQIVMIILFAISLLLTSNQHGKAKEGKYNFWAALVSVMIQVAVLYWGGFFKL